MDGYIKKSEAVDVIVKYPYDIAGKTATAIKMIEDLPSADVVEVGELKCQEIETLKDNNEHLAVMLEEAKAEVDCLKYNLKAVLEEIPETKREFASEIFAEIEKIAILTDYLSVKDFYTEHPLIAELKKKYTEGKVTDRKRKIIASD